MLPSLTRAASTGCSKKVTTSVSIGSSTFSCISGTVVIVGLYGQQEYIIVHLFGYSKGVDSTVHSFCPGRTVLIIESISASMILSNQDKRSVLDSTFFDLAMEIITNFWWEVKRNERQIAGCTPLYSLGEFDTPIGYIYLFRV